MLISLTQTKPSYHMDTLGIIIIILVHINCPKEAFFYSHLCHSFDFCMLDEDTTRNRNMDPQENLGQVKLVV